MADSNTPKKFKQSKVKDQNWEEKIETAKKAAGTPATEPAAVPEESKASEPTPQPEIKPAPTPVTEKKEQPKQDDKFETYFNDNAGQKHVVNVPHTPTEEEVKREERYKEAHDGDASSLVQDIIGCGEDIDAATSLIEETRKQNKKLTREDIDASPELKELYTWAAQLSAALEDKETFGSQRDLLVKMIDALNRHDVLLKQLDEKLRIAKVNTQLTGKPKVYKGNEAIQLINNRYRGIYKIQLHNSGFWVKIIPLTPANMDAWIHEVDFQYKQLGRLIGGHFYLGFGVYLKQKLADLLRLTVVDTNLQNWKEGTTLIDNISIHDYDTICWAYACLMHRNGIEISTVCTNPNCKHQSSHQFVDIARCAFINPAVYTKEAMEFMLAGSADGVIRTKQDLQKYRQQLLKNRKFYTFNTTDQLELTDPSLGDYIRTGMAVLGKLAGSVKDGKLDITDEAVQRQTAYQLSTMFSAWVHSIIIKNEKGEVQAVIDDHDAIAYQLETVIADKSDFVPTLEEFMTNSKVSFYAYTNAKCPKCGKQTDLLKDNINPLDMEYILFCLSYLKLEQIGTSI